MAIHNLLHITMWLGIAAELLVNPSMDVVEYKRSVCDARNEFPLNLCALCQEFSGCADCPLTFVGFCCADGWYHEMLRLSTPLYVRFYYALRCAGIGSAEDSESWVIAGINSVLELLALKPLDDEIKGLASLYGIIEHHLDIDVVRRRYYCNIIKARLAELGESEVWLNVDET